MAVSGQSTAVVILSVAFATWTFLSAVSAVSNDVDLLLNRIKPSIQGKSEIHLLSLQLPSANLSGTIPPEIGEFSSLESLYLSVNSISGSIPLEIGYSSSLSDVDLGKRFEIRK